MRTMQDLSLLVAAACAFLFPVSAGGHGKEVHEEKGHHMEAGEAMRAQHERMAKFAEAAGMLSDAIIHNSMKLAVEGAALLDKSLAGHESDVPHKNRAKVKEFHGLFVELGKRTRKLNETIAADDLPRTAVAYGRILEICASCHKTFRD